MTTTPPTFEEALEELEGIVARLEAGELTLEQAIEQFERGQQLAAQCHQALNNAELRLEQIGAED